MPQTPMRLDDLLARDVHVQWFEAVAIVQSVCRQLIDAGRIDGFPSPPAILIDADGDVTLRGVPPIGDAVSNAAHTLSGMLTNDFPVQLRLIVTQAADGTHQTLEDFSGALAYYERPDAGQILRAFHQRASQAPRRAEAGPPAEEPAFVQQATPRESRSASAGRRELWPLAAAILIVALIGGAIWVLEFGSGSTQVDSAIDTFKGTVSRTLGVASADAKVEPTGDTVAVEAPAGTPRARTSARPAAAVRPRPDAKPPASPAHVSTDILANVALPAAETPDLASPADSDPRFYATMDIVANTWSGEGAVPPGEGARIYTRLDPGVVPPRPIYPILPAAPPPGAPLDGRTVVDLVIAPTGRVEGAKLRTPPRNIHEFMLLSAAKAWRFDPAVHEDGYAVRFRHSVVITAYP